VKIDVEVLKQVMERQPRKNCLERFFNENAQLILEMIEKYGIDNTVMYLNRYLRKVKKKGDGLPFVVPRSELRKWLKKVKVQMKGVQEGEKLKKEITRIVQVKNQMKGG